MLRGIRLQVQNDIGGKLLHANSGETGIIDGQGRPALLVIICDISLLDLSAGGITGPKIAHISIIQAYLSLTGVSREFLQITLLDRLITGQEKLVPEQSLKGIERDAMLLEEIDLTVVGLDILLMHTVDDQHVGRCELQAADLRSEERDKELDADDTIPAHAQLSGNGDILVTGLDAEVHLPTDILRIDTGVIDFLYILQATEIVLRHGLGRGSTLKMLRRSARGEGEEEGEKATEDQCRLRRSCPCGFLILFTVALTHNFL